MKYLNLFDTATDYEAAKSSLESPWVALVDEDNSLQYSVNQEPEPEPEPVEDPTVAVTKGEDEFGQTIYTLKFGCEVCTEERMVPWHMTFDGVVAYIGGDSQDLGFNPVMDTETGENDFSTYIVYATTGDAVSVMDSFSRLMVYADDEMTQWLGTFIRG